MMRFILRRSYQDQGTASARDTFETIDVECPALQALLQRGGSDPCGGHDLTHLVGVEVLHAKKADSK